MSKGREFESQKHCLLFFLYVLFLIFFFFFCILTAFFFLQKYTEFYTRSLLIECYHVTTEVNLNQILKIETTNRILVLSISPLDV